jgi:putative acetyltransferase
MVVRRYRADDRDTARWIQAEAFRRPDTGADRLPPEVAVLDALLDAGDAIDALSFVAVRDQRLIGHVVCSRATVGSEPVVALGPIGVLPAYQRDGVGKALVHSALAAADAREEPLMALLGDPAYYGRFGFVPAGSVGVEAPEEEWGAAFQVRLLHGYDAGLRGPFRYAPAFALV